MIVKAKSVQFGTFGIARMGITLYLVGGDDAKRGELDMAKQMSYEDAERIRKGIGMNKIKFRGVLQVSRTKYWRWKNIGVEGPARQLLRIIDARPESVDILAEND